jgi:hypothetical protein
MQGAAGSTHRSLGSDTRRRTAVLSRIRSPPSIVFVVVSRAQVRCSSMPTASISVVPWLSVAEPEEPPVLVWAGLPGGVPWP